jgi:hypothetical protein
MRKTSWFVLALVLLAAFPVASSAADDMVTMTGEYYWEEGHDEGVLKKVEFTPTGEGAWDVAFYFSFRGRDHIYKGTAEGSLTEGALEGNIRNENEERSFTFSGEFADGTFTGEHSETEGSSSWSTGTMSLTP